MEFKFWYLFFIKFEAFNQLIFDIKGTFITEWDLGFKECQMLFKKPTFFADQLIEIAKYYGFDGWFINIENPIPKEQIRVLQQFIVYLRQRMQQVISNSIVLWYDSVLITGELKWQNQLNHLNQVLSRNFYSYTKKLKTL